MYVVELDEILKTSEEEKPLYAEIDGKFYTLGLSVGELRERIKDVKKDRCAAIQKGAKSYDLVFLQTFKELAKLQCSQQTTEKDPYLIPVGKSVSVEKLFR